MSESTTDAAAQPASGAGSPAAFPIVGIGASAGGLAAFEAFFAGMPAGAGPGMAFVLVQHLAPDHKSILSELIRRYTRMQVFEVEDGMTVRPDCAYIIPPGRDMAILNGTLQLLEPSAPRGQRLPIDFFFRSLVQDQHEHAIGIVLSGTGSDGALGVRAIKGEGGMVMAQNPASTEFDGMPRAAIATGLVDYELPPAEMAAHLIAYVAHAFGKLPRAAATAPPQVESAMKKIFILLRTQTGHDFSLYKPSTIQRRIERRMAVQQIDGISGYVKFLQQTPAEIEALFRDLLIGVTHFFRDPEAFRVLEDKVIPALFAGRPAGATIRVWTPGCASGEEAYSIAILLVERMEALKTGYTVQLFATDIDAQAIANARAGLYPASIAADLSPERLARFFTPEADGSAYRIHKAIRDLLVFSDQDVIKDPPFSRLDLISCRNLLIYMGSELQKKLIPLFHYALNPEGWLFLGSSEGVGEHGTLFDVLDRKAKLYRRLANRHGQQRTALGRVLPLVSTALAADAPAVRRAGAATGGSLREATERALLAQVVAAGALVNARGDIQYLHGRSGMFLEPSPGEAGINNVLKMAREGLRRPLGTALQQAVQLKESVAVAGLSVKTNGHHTSVNLSIRPVTSGPGASAEAPLYLVVLEEAPSAAAPQAAEATAGESLPDHAQARIAELQAELRTRDEHLQSAYEELESSSEELKSANEEMQSVNEELQSTNEELETSKEELQSVNEELATVNAELQTKVTDLSQANNDMNNLLAGTGIGTIFVDHQLRILRFTPAASNIVNLIPSDVGRPVGHLVDNLSGYGGLLDDVRAVLRTLVPRETVVQALDGRRYNMRILPYRTLDNIIEGAVMSFVDVTEVLNTRDALARTTELLERSAELAKVGGWEMDVASGEITYSREAARIHEIDFPAAPGNHARAGAHYGPEALPVLQAAVRAAIDQGTAYDLELPLTTAKGRPRWVRVQGHPVLQGGKTVQLRGTLQDITDHKQTQDALRSARELSRLAVVLRDAHDAITVKDLSGRILAWNPGAVRMYGWSEAEALALNMSDCIPPSRLAQEVAKMDELSRAPTLAPYHTERLTKSGKVVAVSMIASALFNEAGQHYAVATTERLAGPERV
jgi:two-component system, chemotaxis family, CheB/CheR fusion protein